MKSHSHQPAIPPVLLDDLLTVDETALRLRMGRSTLYLELAAGHIPIVRARGSTLIKASDVQGYINRNSLIRTSKKEDGQ